MTVTQLSLRGAERRSNLDQEEPYRTPGRPIVDPRHHLWDHPGSRYRLDEIPADVNSGHNIVATAVFIQCGSGYRTSGPEEVRPIGESEFVRGIAEEADRRGGKTRIL